jgi:hypothetical protein
VLIEARHSLLRRFSRGQREDHHAAKKQANRSSAVMQAMRTRRMSAQEST